MELLRLYQNGGDGSEDALRRLIQLYLPLVHATARRRTGSESFAADVVQTVLIDFARQARSLPPGVQIGGWLLRHTGSGGGGKLAAGNWLRAFAAIDPATAPLAMKTYANTVVDEDPPAAIPQENARRLAMIQLFPKWVGRDTAAARVWLENSSWPPEMKRLGEGALKAAEQ